MDDRVREVLARIEAEEPRAPAMPVRPTTGRFLFALVAPQTDCEVLEVGAGRGVSTLWLAAAARILGGRVVSLERDPEVAADWRRNVADAGLAEWAELIEGDALETLATAEDVFDVVFVDGRKDEYERYFDLARHLVDPGGLVVADNVLSHEVLGAYSRARQSDPTLLSVTVPWTAGSRSPRCSSRRPQEGFDETPRCRRAALLAPKTASSVAPVASGYERSLRPCFGTTTAPRRRAEVRQSLLGSSWRNAYHGRNHGKGVVRL